jgi:hypothetical protein
MSNAVELRKELAFAPERIFEAEGKVLAASEKLIDCEDALSRKEAQLQIDGLPGSSTEARKSHLFLMTEDERRAVREAKKALSEAQIDLRGFQNGFSVLKHCARLIAAELGE